jgi:Ca2+-binding RTX toxin-like protein
MAASAAYTLSANTENLTYVGTGNFNGTGNGLANTIAGGGNADTLSGAGDNDTIIGLGGNDTLGGGAGDDTFVATAGDGNDGYAGGSGSDTYSLAGLTADATINLATGTASSSEIGTDTLTTIENVVGGSGQDTITASNAHNTFSGGTGNDTFVFASTGAAGIGANRDMITDFAPAADRFDLSGIDANGGQAGNPEFVFVGELTNVVGGVGQLGRGQLGYHYETDANGIEHTIVEGSVDADAAAAFQIDLVGRHTLSAGDFLL